MHRIKVIFLTFYCIWAVEAIHNLDIPAHDPTAYNEGIFGKFTSHMLNLLSGGLDKKNKKYCKLLHKELHKVDYEIARKMAKVFKTLSKDKEAMPDEFETYKDAYANHNPKAVEFFKAMDEVVNAQQGGLFDDYAHDLLDYANDFKRSVKQETINVINSIVKAIERMGSKDRVRLGKKLKAAIKEYKNFNRDQEEEEIDPCFIPNFEISKVLNYVMH